MSSWRLRLKLFHIAVDIFQILRCSFIKDYSSWADVPAKYVQNSITWYTYITYHHDFALRWRHNGCDSVPNHQPRECLLRRLIRWTSKKTSKLRVIGLCAGNSPETGEFPAQMASNAENVSIWWRHHGQTEKDRCDNGHFTKVGNQSQNKHFY